MKDVTKNLKPTPSLNVLLTGATGGIGEAAALKLYAMGANLVLIGRNRQKLKALVDKLDNTGNKQASFVFGFECDINSGESRQQLLGYLQELPFNINTLINNAGVNQFKWFEHTSTEAMNHMLQTNVLAPMELIQLMLPMLKRQSSSQIINVGSTFGSIGYPGYSAYCASKFALRGFSQSLSRELADTGVRVKYLSPRATNTKLNSPAVQAMNKALNTRTDNPDVVAMELVKLLKANACEHYIGWPEKFFVKLNQLLPSVVAKSIVKQLPLIKQYAIQ